MIEQIIIGAIQGITEWLPISSSGVITLIKKVFLHSSQSIGSISRENLFLHLGTFLSALVYLRKDVVLLTKNCFSYKRAPLEQKNTIQFLFLTTLLSGIIGIGLLKGLDSFESQFDATGKSVTTIIGILLLITGIIELKAHGGGQKKAENLSWVDSLLLGIAQGFAALPGISRSGITVSSLLLRKFDKSTALRLSFLMSLPIVFAGNILLHITDISFSLESCVGLLSAFVFGILSMHALIKIAQKVNFGYFMIFFGGITIVSIFF